MGLRYGVRDLAHHEFVPGWFKSMDAVIEEFHRLAAVPWGQEPNLPPCDPWETCASRWTAFEYKVPGWEISRSMRALRPVRRGQRILDDIWVEVSAEGVTWSDRLSDVGP